MHQSVFRRAAVGRDPGVLLLFCCLTALGPGCSTEATVASVVGGTVGATILGGYTPSHEIEQIYYLGVFDPQEQVPPTIYRVRVRGQASLISRVKFASGWVKAGLIDSLATVGSFEGETARFSAEEGEDLVELKTGRRLMLFGPEGFREAPRDHRLVIVMGTSPEVFFQAIDESLGAIAEVQREQLDSRFSKLLFEELLRIQNEQIQIAELQADLNADFAGGEGR